MRGKVSFSKERTSESVRGERRAIPRCPLLRSRRVMLYLRVMPWMRDDARPFKPVFGDAAHAGAD